jgi:hypothetical protein
VNAARDLTQQSSECHEMTCSPLQYFYSSSTVNPVNRGEQRRTQKGLGKGISNLDQPR